MNVEHVSRGYIEHVLSDEIIQALMEFSNVTFLVSGGSCIDIAVAVLSKIERTKHLTVILCDERYGDIGHIDSNWRQLLDSGYEPEKFNSLPVLIGESIVSTTMQFIRNLELHSGVNTKVIALLGIGVDGHTAGLLPNVQALEVSGVYATHYPTPTYNRITITGDFFEHIDSAYMCASSESKLPVLESLVRNESVADQPAQLVKKCKTYRVMYVS